MISIWINSYSENAITATLSPPEAVAVNITYCRSPSQFQFVKDRDTNQRLMVSPRMHTFLVSTKRLYWRVCPSDRPSVCLSVISYFFGLLGATWLVCTVTMTTRNRMHMLCSFHHNFIPFERIELESQGLKQLLTALNPQQPVAH